MRLPVSLSLVYDNTLYNMQGQDVMQYAVFTTYVMRFMS